MPLAIYPTGVDTCQIEVDRGAYSRGILGEPEAVLSEKWMHCKIDYRLDNVAPLTYGLKADIPG